MTGCASTKLLNAPPPIECSKLIPEEWKTPVKGVSVLPSNATVGTLGVKLDSQTMRLDVANSRIVGTQAIVKQCDQLNIEAHKEYTKKPKFLGLF